MNNTAKVKLTTEITMEGDEEELDGGQTLACTIAIFNLREEIGRLCVRDGGRIRGEKDWVKGQ